MDYQEFVEAVENFAGNLATIVFEDQPNRDFLADIEFCSERDGEGCVYLFWVDRRIMASYAETLTVVRVDSIREVHNSGIPADDCSVAYLGDDWRETMSDPLVFPGAARRAASPPERA